MKGVNKLYFIYSNWLRKNVVRKPYDVATTYTRYVRWLLQKESKHVDLQNAVSQEFSFLCPLKCRYM